MAVAFDSVEEKDYDEEWDSPQSPRADYGLTDDFDPTKYNFYNPITYIAKAAGSGPLAEQTSPVSSKHHGGNGKVTDNYDEGSPEPLSPIEELDDDVRSLQTARKSKESIRSLFFQDESPASALNEEVKANSAALEQAVQGLSALEVRTDLLCSRPHLQAILTDRPLALKFVTFLRTYRPSSALVLTYYLGAVKALKALRYADSIIDSLEAVPDQPFTNEISSATMAWVVEDKLARALDVLVQDMPAFVAYIYTETIDMALFKKMNGGQDPTPRATSDGLAEAFILFDPASPDNLITFTSEGFHSLTGYSREEILGRNSQILSGNHTDPSSIKRLESSFEDKREHCEILLNYRRDGSPFVNMVMSVPLRDKTNRVRYYLGAQLDVSEFVNDRTGFSSLHQIVERERKHPNGFLGGDLSDSPSVTEDSAGLVKACPALELEDLAAPKTPKQSSSASSSLDNGRSLRSTTSSILPGLSIEGIAPSLGFYPNYLLARPHPSMRVLFTSPRLRSLGVLQRPLLDNIGGSSRVRQDLARALEMGRKVTAKVQWLSRSSDPTSCWLHCTPLLGVSDSIGVWIILLVDAHSGEDSAPDPVRAPHPQGSLIKEPLAADPTPWDETRKQNLPTREYSRENADHNTLKAKDSLQAASSGTKGVPKESGQGPSMLKAKPLSPVQAGGRVIGDMLEGGNRAATENELSTVAPRSGNASTISQISRQDQSSSGSSDRPLSSGSSKASIRRTMQPTVRVPARSIDEPRVGKPAPINMPGPPQSSTENVAEGVLPVRKRTYKSLSPYGIIFDG